MHKCNHGCEHKNVKYCDQCGKVHCMDCGREWGEKEYIYTLPYINVPSVWEPIPEWGPNTTDIYTTSDDIQTTYTSVITARAEMQNGCNYYTHEEIFN
jgi:hypothetical protein